MQGGVDFSLNIAIHKFPWNFEPLSENIQCSVTPDETNKHNAPIGHIFESWEFGSRRKRLWDTIEFINCLQWCPPLQAAVAMMFIMESLKIFALPFEC